MMMASHRQVFANRGDAGRRLAKRLLHLRDPDTVVVGLPRGGVPVAYEVARALEAPLDVILVRKLGLPFQPELAMGAIGEGGARVIDEDVVRMAHIGPEELAAVERREQIELDRRARQYRRGQLGVELADRVVVIVDDGIATGSTAKAACQVARRQGARRIVLAVPVAPTDWTARLAGVADELIALSTPDPFHGVGEFYVDFGQTSDEEVIFCLEHGTGPRGVPTAPIGDRDVGIELDEVRLGGHVTIPPDAVGIVIFAHGSGSSRHSPRNRYVASTLNEAGLATLLFDLLTADEEAIRATVFDIDLLTRRLVEVTRWVAGRPDLAGLPICYFGASTGAAAALSAAAELGDQVAAVVSRGGRPDLAAGRLAAVRSPTLLIVGGRDEAVLGLNQAAGKRLRCPNRLEVVPGAGHLFEEPGTLLRAAQLAQDWLVEHAVAAGPACRR